MKATYVPLIIFMTFMVIQSHSQITDNSKSDVINYKAITISDFCLCKTTLHELRTLSSDFSQVEVEEMDSPKNCYGQDSRYESGKGYASKKYSGLIFQTEQTSDYVSKIRLTKDFKGSLPNGAYVDMSNLTLKDVFKIYPKFIDKWGSRGCSDYWNFSNDTISFYVKIDKNIKPQFPINEAFYLDKPVDAIDLVFSCYKVLHKSNAKIELFNPNEPVLFVDSIRVNQRYLESAYQPNEFAFITVYKGDDAVKLVGEEGRKNGAVYLTTKEAAREKYSKLFGSKSAEYLKVIKSKDNDADIAYILNGKILTENIEAELYKIDKNNLLEIRVIYKKDLKKEFNISDKKYGVVLKTSEH